MYCAQIMLLVVVLECGEVVAGNQVVTQFGIAADILELVDALAATGHAQAVVAFPVAATGLVKLTCAQGQVVDLVGGKRGAAVGLWQQAAVVSLGNRQVGLQTAPDDQLGVGDFGFTGKIDLAEFTFCLAVVLEREQVAGHTAVARLGGVAAARVQTDTCTGRHIHTKPDQPLGIT